MKRLSKNKRHISPAIIGAGIGLASNIFQAGNQKNAAVDAQNAMLAQFMKQKGIEDVALLDEYDTNGINRVNYYADGGSLSQYPIKGKYKTIGGDLHEIADGVEVAKGNTHGEKTIDNQYGITLIDGQKPVAEIEDEEVLVDNERVFSDRLMYDKKNSFADKMKKVANKSAKIEKKLGKTTDVKSRNGYERQLAGMKMAEEVLYNEQELVKQEEGKKELDILAYGGPIQGTMSDEEFAKSLGKFNPTSPDAGMGFDYKSFGNQIAPLLVDNIGNALIGLNTPKLPKPMPVVTPRLETQVNVAPQLSAITDAETAITDTILNNTSNSNTARNNIASSRNNSLRSRLNVLGEKENIERGLRNQNAEIAARTANANSERADNYNMMEFTRAGDIQGRTSANLANLSLDINDTLTRMDKDKYYEEIEFLDLLDDPTGEKARTVKKNGYARMSPRQKRLFDAEQKRKNK